MKRILGLISTLAFLGCANDNSGLRYNPVDQPNLDWQKQSDTVERGFYVAEEEIKKSEFRQIDEPLCLRSPDFDARVKAGSRAVMYVEMSPAENETQPVRALQMLQYGDIREGVISAKLKQWSVVDGTKHAFLELGTDIQKVDIGNGQHAVMTDWQEVARGATTFPKVNESAMLTELVAGLDGSVDAGSEFTIGKFSFGNGAVTKAARALYWQKMGDGAYLASMTIVIPLATDLFGLNCAPEIAYGMFAVIENGKVAFKMEGELLDTTAW